MTEMQEGQTYPDLTQGIPAGDLADGAKLVGRVGEEQVLLVRFGQEIFAVGAHCTHYHAPLIDGLLVGRTMRCPWHHACFDLQTGEALAAPAFGPLECWAVEQRDGKIFVRERILPRPRPRRKAAGEAPEKIVIVGGGAAGFAAAEMLRREEYQGSIVMLSDDDAPPVDRPNLSKDYLAGTAPEDWIPLRSDDFYAENGIELRLKTDVRHVNTASRIAILADGSIVSYDRLLLATGAEPVRLPVAGADLPFVHTLRTLADCRAIIEHAKAARRAVVLGASFIGLEAAAALRARGIDVHVVAPERIPMERIFGPQMGSFVRSLHEEHGVTFHLEDIATGIDARQVHLKSGGKIEADLAIVGVGVRPRTGIAERSGLTAASGVVVNSYLETSVPGIFAAGDIARWPDKRSGEAIRVEHWAVAQRQGQTAARNMLGCREAFTAVPFFWSQHYDVPINYVGHAEKWDELEIEGDIASKDCLLRFKRGGRLLAVASIFRDIANLEAELIMERETAPAFG